jgi:glutathione S-transferase
MKLYYSPGACSQAPHILMHELGQHHEAELVDLRAKRLEDGSSYLDVNPKGAVPALVLDNGEVLTENAVILQYLGDRSGSSDALPSPGHFSRYRVLEYVNFITTELHKRFSLLFSPETLEEMKPVVKSQLGQKLDYIDRELGDGPFLMGEELTLPDPYLFVMTGWAEKMLGGLERWPNLKAFRERMMQRRSVREVLEFEGLLKEEPAL